MTIDSWTPTEERPWSHCEGGLWECPRDGLNWCTDCDPHCQVCKTARPPTSESLISSSEIASRAGITIRRLDLWVKAGRVTPIVNPGGTGRPRRWHPSQIGEIVEVRETESEPARSAAAQARSRRMR